MGAIIGYHHSPPVAKEMSRSVFPLFFFCMLCVFPPVFGDLNDCIWGGKNEETSYSPAYLPGMGDVVLVQYQQPAQMNLGAPQPAIPVQATPQTQPVNVQQANIPTITIPTGPVGSVGQPATFHGAVPLAPPGTEIVYVMPSSLPSEAVICVDGTKTIPAAESKVVPAGTPGAIPVALQTVMVRKPKTEYRWAYAPVTTKTETLVQVVDSRTGRVVRTYCKEDSERTMLPWLHRREIVTYETVAAKVGVPVSVNPSVSSSVNTVLLGGSP